MSAPRTPLACPASRAVGVALLAVVALFAVGMPAAGADSERRPGSAAPGGATDAPTAAPANDDLSAAEVITGGSGHVTGTTSEATHEAGEPDHVDALSAHSVWYSWQAPATADVTFTTQLSDFDTVLAAYTGTGFGDLTEVASNDDDFDFPPQSAITFSATSGTTYLIAVDGWFGLSGDLQLDWQVDGEALDNDAFADARPLSGQFVQLEDTNEGASHETGEPDHDGAGGSTSVWFEWVAPHDGDTEFVIFGDSLDPVIAVYTGTSVDALAGLGSASGSGSEVATAVTEGQTYAIAVDGEPSDPEGTLLVEVDLTASGDPVNDDFADRTAIAGPSGSLDADNHGATEEGGEPDHADSEAFRSVWWTWTAPSSGLFTFDTFGSTFDTVLGVYTGDAVDDLTEVASNDQTAGDQSLVRFAATAGTEYQVAVDTWTGDTGDITLSWAEAAATFPDAPTDHPFFAEIEWMNDNGITTGYADGTYKPANTVSRQAMAAFMYRFAGFAPGDFVTPDEPSFSDVPTGHPFYEAIEWMAELGISTGYADGTFKPAVAVSRQAMAAFMVRLLEVFSGPPPFGPPAEPSFSDVPVDHPFYEEIELLAAIGVTTGFGDGTFRPAIAITRQAMSAFLFRLATGPPA